MRTLEVYVKGREIVCVVCSKDKKVKLLKEKQLNVMHNLSGFSICLLKHFVMFWRTHSNVVLVSELYVLNKSIFFLKFNFNFKKLIILKTNSTH